MKKILKCAVMALTLAMLSVSAFALTEGDWEFQLLDDSVMITQYWGDDTDVVIPSEIFGRPVTKLDENPFDDDNEYCQYIKKITVPSTVKEIPSNFLSMGWDEPIVEEVVLPEGLMKIGYQAFSNCEYLKKITIPSTVVSIDSWAFSNCISLKSINIPDSVTSIGHEAFYNSGLTSVSIPGSVKELGSDMFEDCKSLQSVKFAKGVNKVSGGMFSGCISLNEVELPEGLSEIDYAAFYGCTSLTNIILPVSLKAIDNSAFNKTSLKEVAIPNGVTEISNAFQNIETLKSLYIPDTVKTLSSGVISGSKNCIIYCTADSKAAEVCKKYNISYLTDKSVNSGVTVLYNGTRISFHKYDQNPELINNRTLVPLRAIFEAMGAEVTWDDSIKTAIAKRDGIEIRIKIGADEMYKDGQAIPVDVPAQLINDRTMVPVRVIAEAFGAEVGWNASGYTVLINE